MMRVFSGTLTRFAAVVANGGYFVKNPASLTRNRWGLISLCAVFLLVHLGSIVEAQGISGQRRPVVIITVDVESNSEIDLPVQFDAVCTGDVPCGVQEMVTRLEKRGYRATFFLNVYEYKTWGAERMKKMATWLDRSRQDVELHTHPHWAYDANRKYMYEYNLQEQTKIIRDGKDLIKDWTGRDTVAHRAGAYAADTNTLLALTENAVHYDSSLFFGNTNCKLNGLGLRRNGPSMYGPVSELPVTTFQKDAYPPLFGTILRPISSVRKYDINWFADPGEAIQALDRLLSLEGDVLILFLHSYSFIKSRGSTGHMVADVDAIRIFETILEYVEKKHLTVTTFRDLDGRRDQPRWYLKSSDTVPCVNTQIGLVRYVMKRGGFEGGSHWVEAIIVVVSVAVLFAVVHKIRLRRT
jgi:hypothetical protein